MRGAKEEVLAFRTFPGRTGVRSGAPIRSSVSTRRSSAGAGRRDLSQRSAAIRLGGAVVADIHDEWVARTPYFSEASMAKLYAA